MRRLKGPSRSYLWASMNGWMVLILLRHCPEARRRERCRWSKRGQKLHSRAPRATNPNAQEPSSDFSDSLSRKFAPGAQKVSKKGSKKMHTTLKIHREFI